MREQARRCREILSKITELPTAEPFDDTPLSALIEEAVAPHRNFGVSLTVNCRRIAQRSRGACAIRVFATALAI